jgi:3-hydroxyacyl-CoA dehydrogenase
MIGCGSMGGGMALLFAEIGLQVFLSDPAEETMDKLIQQAEKEGYEGKLNRTKGAPDQLSLAIWFIWLWCFSSSEDMTVN